jgi:hypothetical protein
MIRGRGLLENIIILLKMGILFGVNYLLWRLWPGTIFSSEFISTEKECCLEALSLRKFSSFLSNLRTSLF